MRIKTLTDTVYGQELDRLRMLQGFPEVPAARQGMVRALRRITCEKSFLHELVTYFVDNAERCPAPEELSQRAGILRASGERKPLGSVSCLKCNGTGWVHFTKTITAGGMEPYEAEFCLRCACAPAPRVK
ncbi:MAG TPA: hypothetical protein VIX37_13195 [Candidatus Sulfotelmatobacter sp.]